MERFSRRDFLNVLKIGIPAALAAGSGYACSSEIPISPQPIGVTPYNTTTEKPYPGFNVEYTIDLSAKPYIRDEAGLMAATSKIGNILGIRSDLKINFLYD